MYNRLWRSDGKQLMVVSVSNKAAESVQRAPEPVPRLDPAAALLFVINDSAGAVEVDAKCAVIEAALAEQGRKGELLVCGTDELSRVAAKAAATALERSTAVVAVGGDGSLNAVAQAVHAAGCAMGVIPYGTFNYFARTHGIPTEPAAAAQLLLQARPMPVQVSAITAGCFWSMQAWASTPNCCRTARPTKPVLAEADGWQCWPPVQRCCAPSADCACTWRWALQSETCRP